MRLRKTWPFLCQFLETYVAQHYVQISCAKFYQSQSVNAEITRRTSLIPVNKRWLLLHWCLQNSWSHNKFLWTFPFIIFFFLFSPPNWMKNVGSVGKIILCLSVKYGFHCSNFHRTLNCSMALCVIMYASYHPNVSMNMESTGKYIYVLE